MGRRRSAGQIAPKGVPDRLFPAVVAQDRYFGLYSGGLWFAIANADTPFGSIDPEPTRIGFCLEEGPNGTDEEAQTFWAKAPPWIVTADTPEAALEKLSAVANA